MRDADRATTETEGSPEASDPFSPLRRDNLHRAGLALAAATAVFAIVLGLAWASRGVVPSEQVRACELIADLGTVTLEEVLGDDAAPPLYRQLARVHRLAADSGHTALADAARTAMAGLEAGVELTDQPDGRSASLFARGLTDARNECSILGR